MYICIHLAHLHILCGIGTQIQSFAHGWSSAWPLSYSHNPLIYHKNEQDVNDISNLLLKQIITNVLITKGLRYLLIKGQTTSLF